MPSLGGTTVRILCDQLPLEEYSCSVDAVNTSAVSCWIASIVDKSFSVYYQFDLKEGCGWSCNFYCDGVLMRSGLVKPEILSMKHNKARSGENIYPVRFSELVATDGQGADMNPVNPDLGTIKITIQRVERGWKKAKDEPPSTPQKKRFVMDDSPVHERKKSLIGHRVKLNPLYEHIHQLTHSDRVGHPMLISQKKDVYDIQLRDLEEVPYRTFIFHYRPKALLQALGHAPLSPRISVRTTKRDRSVLSDSEPEAKPELDREEEEIQAQMEILKQKKEEIAARRRDAKRVKKEDLEITVPAEFIGEVIDLCSE